jgi:hypothetical protein
VKFGYLGGISEMSLLLIQGLSVSGIYISHAENEKDIFLEILIIID